MRARDDLRCDQLTHASRPLSAPIHPRLHTAHIPPHDPPPTPPAAPDPPHDPAPPPPASSAPAPPAAFTAATSPFTNAVTMPLPALSQPTISTLAALSMASVPSIRETRPLHSRRPKASLAICSPFPVNRTKERF